MASAHTSELKAASEHYACARDGDSGHDITSSSTPQSPAPQAEVAAVSSQSTRPTHISARRTFAGGIVRYYLEPDTPAPRDTSKRPRRLPADFARGVLSRCRRKEWWRRHSPLKLHLFADVTIWKAALAELLGTLVLTAMILLVVTGVVNHKEDYSYFPTAIAVCHIPLIAFMILATATTSGGRQTHIQPAHNDLNPIISFSTCLAGLTEFPRMVLYISAQVLGAIIGSYLAKHLTPSHLLPLNQLGDLFVLYVAFGVALDDTQRQALPGWLPPFIISTTFALLIYCTAPLSGLGNGAIAFPTRCFGPAVAMGLVTAHTFQLFGSTVVNAQWIYWVGPFIASCIMAALYHVVPPGYTARVKAERRQRQQRQRLHGEQQQLASTEGPQATKRV